MHNVIIGTAQSGKTTLAMELAKACVSQGEDVYSYDPLWGRWPNGVRRTPDIQQLLDKLWNETAKTFFVDESSTSLNKWDASHDWLATQSHHWGHRGFFIAQRPQQLSVTIRANCDSLFLFKSIPKDSHLIAEDFCNEELVNAVSLERGEFYFLKKGGELRKMKLNL